MIPLVYQDIFVATYELIRDDNSNLILGYKYVQIYCHINFVNKSILILNNIKNIYWIWELYNENSSKLIIDYIIPSYSLNNNKLYIKNKYLYKKKDINKGEYGDYTKNFSKITKNKGNRADKKIFLKFVKIRNW